MSKVFKIFAIIYAALMAIVIIFTSPFLLRSGGIVVIFGWISGVISVMMFYAVGQLLERVSHLEEQLGIDLDDKLPQVTCKQCGREYDMDYPKCPHCDATTDFSSTKNEEENI